MKKVNVFMVEQDDINKMKDKALEAKQESDYWALCAFRAANDINEGGTEFNENDLQWYKRREQYYYGKYNAILDILDMFGIDRVA